MVADPTMVASPLGIRQKNIVVTCNYVARTRGVGMYVMEAVSLCPDLVLVNGEDLARYSTLLRVTECEVERLDMTRTGLDDGWMVEMRIREGYQNVGEKNVMGLECDEGFGCEERLLVGSIITRELIRREHGLTCSAGVTYNKLLANKTENQTVGACGMVELFGRLVKVTSLPGVCRKMGELLEGVGVATASIDQLRQVGIEPLGKSTKQQLYLSGG